MKRVLLILLLVTINVTAQTNPAKFRDGVKTPFIQYENLTTNEKLAIPQVEGTLVYDTDLNRLQIYNGNVWVNFFDNTIDTSDDIIEGFNNNFLTADERAKLLNIDNTTNNTFVGLSAGDGVTAGGVTATGIDAAQNSTGANITATGNGAAQGAQGNNITVHGANAGGDAIGMGIVGVGSSASRYARGNNIITVGTGAGSFPIGNTLQTPNSTAIGAFSVIDKANQAVIGNSQVTELKIGETLVIDKDQIVTGAEGFLVTKKVGSQTVVDVSNDIQNQINSIQFEGVKTYQSLSALPDPLNLPDGLAAKVANDTTVTNNGYYSVVSGVWVKDSDLHENIVEETNTTKGVTGKAVFDEVELKTAYLKEINGSSIFKEEDVSLTAPLWNNGGIRGASDPNDGGYVSINAFWRTRAYKVSEGDTLKISTTFISHPTPKRPYGFYTEAPTLAAGASSLFISGGDETVGAVTLDEEEIVAPAGAEYLLITYSSGTPQINIIEVLKSVKSIDVVEEIEDINSKCKDVELEDIFEVNPVCVTLIDSLTAGAGGTNYGDSFQPFWNAQFYETEIGLTMFSNNIASFLNISYSRAGLSEMGNETDFSILPQSYSLNGYGLFSNNASNAWCNWDILKDYDLVTVYYLQQPGGGTFNVKTGTGLNTSVNTDGALEVKSIDILRAEGDTTILNFNAINGKVALFGAWFKKGTNSAHLLMLGEGGKRMGEIGQLNSTARQYWYNEIKPAVVLFDAGMNDRTGVNILTKSEFKGLVETYINDVDIASPNTDFILINPNQSADYLTTNLPLFEEARSELALEYSKTLINVPDIGDYNSWVNNNMMLDAVHPNQKGNRAKTKLFLKALGISPYSLGRK